MASLVTVCVMTYNQINYIKECLESILSQSCNFQFDVLIIDDFSTDGTREFLLEESKKNTNIKLLLNDKNYGGEYSYLKLHKHPKTKYIASVDGDDFWLNGKLQYQIDFLEKNTDYNQIWTFANYVDKNSKVFGVFPGCVAKHIYPSTITKRDIAYSYALVGQRSTQVYRRNDLNIDDLSKNFLDYHVSFLLSLSGNAYYSKKILSCYRVVKNASLTTDTTNKKRITVDYLSNDIKHLRKSNPELSTSFNSNILVRSIFSKFKNHDLTVIQELKNDIKIRDISKFDFFRSLMYFIVQKVFL